MVIENAPLLRDGSPMPTLYWLVDPVLREAVSRLEAAGGVRRAADAVPPAAVADAHDGTRPDVTAASPRATGARRRRAGSAARDAA